MGITLIEQTGIIAGIVIGVSSFIYSVVQVRRQRELAAKQLAEERELAAKQLAEEREYAAELAAKQLAEQREYAAKQLAEQRELAAKQLAEEREYAAELAAKQAAELALKERLYFLANLIVDKDIPRSSRQIFFDEYIAKGGNGSFVKHWYNEGKELEAKKGG